MNAQNDIPNPRIEESPFIPRFPNTFDLSRLTHDIPRNAPQSKYRHSVPLVSVDQTEGYSSENSQILYMASSSKRSRKLRSSLSSLGNQETRIMRGLLDTKVDAECSDSESIAWNVINREIFEWQHVCRTGRPYWWSPESKYSRSTKMHAALSKEVPPQPRTGVRPKNSYSKQRRTVSDSHFTGKDCVEDLAHLVAIQLLGSCFTLPIDRIALPSSDCNSYKRKGRPNSHETGLISSLKMHTNFRYTPSFGHQARNTSPIQLWSGAYDGPSPGTSPPHAVPGFQTPIFGNSGSLSRRRKAHRPLNVTEDSNDCCSEQQSEECLKSAKSLDPAIFASARCRRQEKGNRNAGSVNLPYSSSEQSCSQQRPNAIQADWETSMPESYRGVLSCSRSRSPTTNYRLQPVIRSEPHHVFIQPVKELVVKRGKTFRRRFSGSLHSPLPTHATEFMSEFSSPHSSTSSTAMSSDGRTRRQRAQERGDIQSSADSTPHYNSPVSGYESPDGNSLPEPFWIDSVNPSPNFQLSDPLAAAAALAIVETEIPSKSSSLKVPNISMDSGCSTQLDHPWTAMAISQTTAEVQSPIRSLSAASSQSYTKGTRKRQNGKSILSEMHTPEDLAENIAGGEAKQESVNSRVLSAAEGALGSPREGQEEAQFDMNLVVRTEAGASTGNLGPHGEFSTRRMTLSSETRPSLRLSRVSTSGTQVFTTSDEGVEIDGLPVGPGKELWKIGRNKRRERTYL